MNDAITALLRGAALYEKEGQIGKIGSPLYQECMRAAHSLRDAAHYLKWEHTGKRAKLGHAKGRAA
jgi:hypothetical protein